MKYLWVTWLFAVSAFTFTPGASAQGDRPRACAADEHRQFDFWLGAWDVFETNGTAVVADVRVTADLDGCVIREQYHDTQGLQGESLSSYDGKTGTWQQTWVTNRGQLLVIHGRGEGAAMVFSGWIHEGANESLVRATWSPDGSAVRETAQRSADGGKTWSPWFDLMFRLKTR